MPVYDVVAIMCDQVNGRLSTIDKFGYEILPDKVSELLVTWTRLSIL